MARTDAFAFRPAPAAPQPEGIIAILIGLAADPKPFDPGFLGGVTVAAGDLDAAPQPDGYMEYHDLWW